MKKNEFLKMMFQDNETESEPTKSAHEDVIECMYLALSQTPDTFDVPSDKTAPAAYELVMKRVQEKIKNSPAGTDARKVSVGPFEAAELIAVYLGAKYERPSKLFATVKPKVDVNLDDFI